MIVSTIGYEGATLSDFIATIKCAGVTKLIDVRELPISRRKGFAKTALREALISNGIGYLHLRGLGDPKPGREAARRGDHREFRRIFELHLQSELAQDDLTVLLEEVECSHACLMCFERDPKNCHRLLVVNAIACRVDIKVQHLGVRDGIGDSREHAAA